jgi:cobalt-zinc-cadmium resistance protein CzcA
MIEKLMAFSLKNHLLISIFTLLLVGLGLWAVARIPIDAFPDVTNIQVEIVGTAPGLSPLEIERSVTRTLEMAMRGLPGLVQTRSITKFGISVVTLVFRDDVDIYFARQQVFERLSEASKSVPPGVDIELGPLATAMGEIYQYTLEGNIPRDEEEKVLYFTELRTVQDWIISPMLKGVPGVNEVNSFGGYLKQYQVLADPDKLLKYGVTLPELYQTIQGSNENVGGNIIERFGEQFIVRGIGMFRSVSDIENTVLKSYNGTPVFIKDVARATVGHALRQGASIKDGQEETVGGIVMMLRGENSREVVKGVEAKVREINSANVLPDGLTIRPFYKRSDIVGASISTVLKALAEGAILVLIVLLLFLRSFRGALIIIVSLPLSVFLTFLVMKTSGLTANLMSLGGLAISIGMIIDATIIQVENVQKHLSTKKEQEHKISTVLGAVLEVTKPSIFGQLIIAITFLPILTLQGMEGKMFSPLALTVAIALLASLLLSIFVIPVLCALFLKPGPHEESFLMRQLRRGYVPLLEWSLKNRWRLITASALLLVCSLALTTRLGTEFIPIMDEGAFDMDVQLLPGISLTKAVDISKATARRLKRFPELDTLVSRTGLTGIALEARGVDKTGYVGALKPRSEWTSAHSREELTEKMRQALADIPGMAFAFSQPIQCRIDELVAGTRAQLIVKVFGDDLEVLKAKAAEISAVIAKMDGVADLVVERTAGQPYVNIHLDRDRMARYGVGVRDALEVVEIAIGGRIATQVYEGNRSFDLAVRFPEEKRHSLETLRNIRIEAGGETAVPLHQIAEISLDEGPVQISREDGQRRIGIEVNIHGRDIGGFVAEAKQRIGKSVALPTGVVLAWGGQFENQQQAMRRLSIITPIAVALIFLLLFLTFNSIRLAGLVILNLPLALIGGIIALFVSGLYLSVPSSVGFIVLFGVAVLNGVVLVSYISLLRQQGMGQMEAVRNACESRLRPVLMTASITIFSLVPLLFATGPGSEIQKPLAVVVVGGLITSTFLTLLVLPALYGWFEKETEEVEI